MSAEFESTGSSVRTRRFEIEGKSLGFPALFQDGSSAVGLFMVPSGAAQELVRDTREFSAGAQMPPSSGLYTTAPTITGFRDFRC